MAGQTPKSRGGAQQPEEGLRGAPRRTVTPIEIIDLLKNPRLARSDQIVAIPTLVRKLPEPVRKIIGDLSNTERTLVGLQLKPQSCSANSARSAQQNQERT